jgi:branched-chain amino acid transport system permease protein
MKALQFADKHVYAGTEWRKYLPAISAFIVLALLAPLLLNAYWTKTFTSVACLALASASVALLFGQLGMVSLCQFAIAGVGGWFTLRLVHGLGLPFELALLAGGCVASLFGLLTGLPALRMRGLYLALVSLMVAAAFQVVINVTGFPDGGPGWLGKISNGQRALIERPWIAQTDGAYLRYVLVIVALGMALVEWHRATVAGRAWALIRKGEAVATAAGVNVVAYKAWAFGLAGFLAGIAGGLLAGSNGQLDNSGFPVAQSILLFALTVVGGTYHWVGAVVAALLMRALPALLTDSGVDGNLANVFFGFALLVSLVQGRKGIAGQLADIYQPMRRSAIAEGVIIWVAIAVGTAWLAEMAVFAQFSSALGIALVALLVRLALPGVAWALLGFLNGQDYALRTHSLVSNKAIALMPKLQQVLLHSGFKNFINSAIAGLLIGWVAWGVFDMELGMACGIAWVAMVLKEGAERWSLPGLTRLCAAMDIKLPKKTTA